MTDGKKAKMRSPNYPGIDLETALGLVKRAYNNFYERSVAVALLEKEWGYTPHTGPANVALAAVIAFGLMKTEGKGKERKANLTDLALRFIKDQRGDESAKLAIIQEAALKPPMYAEVYRHFGEKMPKNEELRYYLTYERKEKRFSDSGADEFIRKYKATFAFANLGDYGIIHKGDDDKHQPESDMQETPLAPSLLEGETLSESPSLAPQDLQEPDTKSEDSGLGDMRFRLSETEWMALRVKFPITPRTYIQMLKYVKAFEPDGIMDELPSDHYLQDIGEE